LNKEKVVLTEMPEGDISFAQGYVCGILDVIRFVKSQGRCPTIDELKSWHQEAWKPWTLETSSLEDFEEEGK